MAAQKFANNASSLLAATIDDDDVVIQVDAGYGALFPNPGVGEYFVIALENAAGDIEICKCTSRTTDLLTVVRAWEDSIAQSWTGGVTRVELRNTAGSMEQMIQRSGDTMEGDLNMDGHTILDAVIENATITNSTFMGGSITNINGDSCNALTIPENCDPPMIGGSPILTVNNFDPGSVFAAGMVMAFWGDPGDIPSGWAICDGNNGRPDLRNRFIVGVGSGYEIGDTDGIATYNDSHVTEANGGHTHTGGAHTLTTAEIPAHQHRLWVKTASDDDDDTFGFGYGTADGLTGQRTAEGPFGYLLTSPAGHDLTEATGGGGSHTHSLTAAADHTHSLDDITNLPPYCALYWIIKTDPGGDYGGAGTGGGGSGDMYDMYNEDGCTTYFGGQATLMADVDLNSNSEFQINCCESNVFRIRLTEDSELLEPNNPISGQVINIILKQDAVGGWTINWPPSFKFPGGSAPTLSVAANAKDILSCQYDSNDGEWLCSLQQAYG